MEVVVGIGEQLTEMRGMSIAIDHVELPRSDPRSDLFCQAMFILIGYLRFKRYVHCIIALASITLASLAVAFCSLLSSHGK